MSNKKRLSDYTWKEVLKILGLGAIILIGLVMCSTDDKKTESTEPTESIEPIETGVQQVEIPRYTILEDTVDRNIKRTVEVQLPSRLEEEELRVLAEHIYSLSDVDVPRTFIGYRIADTDKDQAYWATTHYNPNLVVKVFGQTASDYEKVKNSDAPQGDILGSWMANRGIEYKLVAYKKGDITYLRSIYGDSTSSDDIYIATETDKGMKLKEPEENLGEYYVINKQGDLEFWSDNGNYYTAKKL